MAACFAAATLLVTMSRKTGSDRSIDVRKRVAPTLVAADAMFEAAATHNSVMTLIDTKGTLSGPHTAPLVLLLPSSNLHAARAPPTLAQSGSIAVEMVATLPSGMEPLAHAHTGENTAVGSTTIAR
jgi:hypothetical protein